MARGDRGAAAGGSGGGLEAAEALRAAAAAGSAAVVAALVRVGAGVDGLVSRRERGVTPLMAAAQGGHVEAVATLLTAACHQSGDAAQATAVRLAAGGGQPAALALLLRARAALHARDLNKWGAAAAASTAARPRSRCC